MIITLLYCEVFACRLPFISAVQDVRYVALAIILEM